VFPYIEPRIWRVGPFEVTLFQLTALLAVIVGWEIVQRRALRKGWTRDEVVPLTVWTTLLGGIGSHVLDVALYQPDAVRARPLLLLEVWGSMSSYGGLLGGVGGGVLVARLRGLSWARVLDYFDIVAFAFAFSWIFGRTGCAVTHDHVGIFTDSILAVKFPGGARYDLGLLELLWTFVMVAAFLWADRRPRPPGFFIGFFFALYGPVRFLLDTLRVGDERYWGWTPGQYLSLAGALLGVWMLTRASAPTKIGKVSPD
jgi:phosphatidylglycerol:prolipoprotein diacylglycerol transferase